MEQADAQLTVPMDQGLDQLASVQLVVVVGIVHLEIVELKLLVGHLAGVDGNFHVLGDVTEKESKLSPPKVGGSINSLFLLLHVAGVQNLLWLAVVVTAAVMVTALRWLLVMPGLWRLMVLLLLVLLHWRLERRNVKSRRKLFFSLPPNLLRNCISILINLLHGNLLVRLILLGIDIWWSVLLLVIWLRRLVRLLISGRLFLRKRNRRNCLLNVEMYT